MTLDHLPTIYAQSLALAGFQTGLRESSIQHFVRDDSNLDQKASTLTDPKPIHTRKISWVDARTFLVDTNGGLEIGWRRRQGMR